MTAADPTVAEVAELPDCDVHRLLLGFTVPATYDAMANDISPAAAFMCDDHFARHGRGLGAGIGQRLILIGGAA